MYAIYFLTNNNNNILCMLLYTKVYIYIYLQGVYDGAGSHHCGGTVFSMGAGHSPCQLISSMVNVLLIHYIL